MLSSTIASRAASAGRMKRLALAVLLRYVGSYVSCLAQLLAERRAHIEFYRDVTAASNLTVVPVVDLGFQVLPHIHFSSLADFLVATFVAVTAIQIMLLQSVPLRTLIIRQWLTLLGISTFLTGICKSFTLLPNPDEDCHYLDRDTLGFFQVNGKMSDLSLSQCFALAMIAQLKRVRTCADVEFISHTVNATLCALILNRYTDYESRHQKKPFPRPSSNTLLHLESEHRLKRSRQIWSFRCLFWDISFSTVKRILIWTFLAVNLVFVVITKLHYTTDVLVNLVVTLLVWKNYHYADGIGKSLLDHEDLQGYTFVSFVKYMEAFSEISLNVRHQTNSGIEEFAPSESSRLTTGNTLLYQEHLGITFQQGNNECQGRDTRHSDNRLPESPRGYGVIDPEWLEQMESSRDGSNNNKGPISSYESFKSLSESK